MCSWKDYFEMKNEKENEARQAAAEFAELSMLSVKSGTTTFKNDVADVQLEKPKIDKSSTGSIHSIMQNCQDTEETSSTVQHSKFAVCAVDKVKNSRTEMRTNDLKDELNNQEVSAMASKSLIHAISKKNLSLLKSADVSSQVPVIAITDPNHLLSKKSLKKTSEVTSENKLNENCDKEVGQININVEETKPLSYSPIVSNGINEITVAEETVNDVCPNCKKLREEMNTVKKQAHSNFHIFKQKLMSTSELITEYHKKNQELEKQIKINSALKKKLDSCYGENGSLRIQLEKTVQANEPLKKTIQRLEYEKSVAQVEKGEIEKHLASIQTDADEAKELIFSSKMKQEALRKEKQEFIKQHEKEKKKVLNQAKLVDKLNEKLKQSRVQVKNLIAARKQFEKEKEKLTKEIHKLQTKNRTSMQKPRPGKASRKSPSGVLSPSPSPPHYHHNTAIDNQGQERKTLLKNMVFKKESKSHSSSSASSDSSCDSESESDDDLKYRLNQILRSTMTSSTRLRLPTYLSPPLSPMPPSPLRVPNSNNNNKGEFNRNSPLVEEAEKIPDADVDIEDSDIAMNDEATLFGDISQSDNDEDFTPLADIPIENTNSFDENVLRSSDKIEHLSENSFKNVLGTPMETTISLNNSLTNNTEYKETLNNTESQEALNNTESQETLNNGVYEETLNNTEYEGTMNNTESEDTLNNTEAKEKENLEKQDNEKKCTFNESEVINKSLNSTKTDFVVSSVGYNLSSPKQQTAIYNCTELVGKKKMQPHHSRSLSFSGTNSDSAFRPVTRSISNLCIKHFEKEFNSKNESITFLSQDTSSQDFKVKKTSSDIEPEPPSAMQNVVKHEDKKIHRNTFKEESLSKSKTGNSIITNCRDVSKTFDLNSETTMDLSCSVKDQDIDESETICSFTNNIPNKPPSVSNDTESKHHDVVTHNKSLPSIISLRKRKASASELNSPKTKMKLTPSPLPVDVNEKESRVVDKNITVHTNDDKENTEQEKETIYPDDTELEKNTDPKKNDSGSVESNLSDEIIVIKKKPLTTRVKKYTNKRRTIITKRKHFVSIAMPILLESISDDKPAIKTSLFEEHANDSEVASFDLATNTSDKKEVHGNNINPDKATGDIYLSPITSEDSHKNSVVDRIPVATSLSIFTTIASHNCPKVTFTCAKTNPASVTRTTRTVLRRHSLFSGSSTSSVPAQRIDRSRSLSPSMFKPPSPPLSPIPPSPRRSMLTPIISPLPTTPLPESVSPLPPSPKITSPPLIRGSALLCSDNSTVFVPKPLAHKSLNAAKELNFSRTVANSVKNTDGTIVNFSRGPVASTATSQGNLEVHKPLVSNPMRQNAAEKIIERADANFASKSHYEQHAACAKKLKTFLSNSNKKQGHNTKRLCNSSTISKAPLSKVPKTITSSVSFKQSEVVETTSKLNQVSKLSSTYTTTSAAFTTTSVLMYSVASPAVDTGVSSVTDVIMSQATNIRMLPKNPTATPLARLPKTISLAVTSVSSVITPTLPAVDSTVSTGMDAFTSVVTSVSSPVTTPNLPTRGNNVSAALDSCILPIVDTISLAVNSISSSVATPTVVAVHTTVPATMNDCTSDKKSPILTVIKPKSLPKDTTISVTMNTCTSLSLVTTSSVVTSAITSLVTAKLPITCTTTSIAMDSCTLQHTYITVPRTSNSSLLPAISATTCSSTTTCSSLLTTMPQCIVKATPVFIGTTISVVTRDSNRKHENRVSHPIVSGAVSKKQNPQPLLKGDSSRYVSSSEDDCLQIITEDSSQDETSSKPQKATIPKKKQPIMKSLSSAHKFTEHLTRPVSEKEVTAKISATETKEEEGEISNSDEEALRIAPEVDKQKKTIGNMEISVVAAPGKVKRFPTNISKKLDKNKKKRNPKETEVGFTLKLLQKYLNTSINQDNLIAALRDRQNLSHVINLNKAYLLLLRTCEETLLPKILRCLETGDSICECEGNMCQVCSQLTCQCPRELPDFCTECNKRRSQQNSGELDLDAQLRKNIFRVCHPKAEKLCTPILTPAEHSLLMIFQEITREKHLENACNSLLNLLHETIFSNQEMLSCERMALCRFYAATCRVYDRLDELVSFIYSLAYDSLPISYPMVFVTCYSVWPSILARADIWSHNQDESEKLTLYKVKLSPLSAVLQLVALGDAVARKESTCQKILEKLLDIKWSSNACYYEDVASELFSLLCNSQLSYVTKSEDGSLVMCEFVFPVIKAMQVLCKRLGWEWCYNVLIVEKSWNVLRAWSEGEKSVCNDTVAIVIRLIGHLCRGGFACGYRDFTELASTLSSFLQKILDCETAESVHIATAYTLLDIAPSDPEKCSFVLRTWLDQCEKAYTIPQSLRQNISYLAPR
ncbi:uncharacterized protein LOC130640725 isoform X2 [Hydractinia symbiolongicarpus]|uniref:uncharacterized protein LOC130640725 isoform X2 n=1 Tax=Hydractinia symbiolongicarpus TaxID=13093 RepID=UPI00254B050A|nr:uncharacterized protein LOC130640725 isoform X2 [Hydractinia symbiolongicarpus]